jgi:hypothetical protein
MRNQQVGGALAIALSLGLCAVDSRADAPPMPEEMREQKQCPSYQQPPDEACEGGKWVSGGVDKDGCENPPSCERPASTAGNEAKKPPTEPEVAQKECPSFAPPAPDFCKDGKIVAGGKDTRGCQLSPKCEKPGQMAACPVGEVVRPFTRCQCPPETTRERIPSNTRQPDSWKCVAKAAKPGATQHPGTETVLCPEGKPVGVFSRCQCPPGTKAKRAQFFSRVCEKVGAATGDDCPRLAPPAASFCRGGQIVSGGQDARGCERPPKCQRQAQLKLCPENRPLSLITACRCPPKSKERRLGWFMRLCQSALDSKFCPVGQEIHFTEKCNCPPGTKSELVNRSYSVCTRAAKEEPCRVGFPIAKTSKCQCPPGTTMTTLKGNIRQCTRKGKPTPTMRCPLLKPIGPNFCKDGKIVPQKDKSGCDMMPKCEKVAPPEVPPPPPPPEPAEPDPTSK